MVAVFGVLVVISLESEDGRFETLVRTGQCWGRVQKKLRQAPREVDRANERG